MFDILTGHEPVTGLTLKFVCKITLGLQCRLAQHLLRNTIRARTTVHRTTGIVSAVLTIVCSIKEKEINRIKRFRSFIKFYSHNIILDLRSWVLNQFTGSFVTLAQCYIPYHYFDTSCALSFTLMHIKTVS